MAIVAITGSAGGIGRATRTRLENGGDRVIGIDRHDAEVIADLGTDADRRNMLRDVAALCDGVLDGLVVAAGLVGPVGPEPATADATVSVNFFAATAALAGFRPFLARGRSPSAVAIGSHLATTQAVDPSTVAACLDGDETAARAAAQRESMLAYNSSKFALARWARRAAITEDWAGQGIRLNVIALGLVETPMTDWSVAFILDHPEILPLPLRRPGRPDEVASLVGYLLSEEATFFCGSLIAMDGGTDAAVRGEDWPAPRPG